MNPKLKPIDDFLKGLTKTVGNKLSSFQDNLVKPRQNITSQNFKPLVQSPAVQNIASNIGSWYDQGSKLYSQQTDPLRGNARQSIMNAGRTIQQAIPSTNQIFEARQRQPFLVRNLMPDNPLSRFSTDVLMDTPRQIGRVLEGSGTPLEQRSFGDKLDVAGLIPGASLTTKTTSALSKRASYLKRVADKQTIEQIKDFVIDVQRTGGKKNYGELGETIHAVGVDVFGDRARTMSNTQLANMFDATLKEVGKSRNVFGLGLATDDIRAGETLAKKPKYAGSINLNRLNVSKAGQQEILDTVDQVREEIQKVRGKPLRNEEVIEAAKEANVLKKVITREESLKTEATLHKLRQAVSAGAEGQGLTEDFIENVRILSSQATDAGRRLQSFSAGADATLGSTKEKIVAKLLNLGHKSDELARAADGVDWNDNRQVVEFYRKFVKPTWKEMSEEFRYMNLLSSPRTHVVNVFSNALQASIVRPSTKLVSGAIDPIASALTKSKRQAYISEVPAYYRGMFASIPEAMQKVRDVYSGKQAYTNLDLDRVPTGTMLSKGNVVTKTLEAMDQFFMTLIQSAETEALGLRASKGVKVTETAEDIAKYSVFRQALKPDGQGAVLNWIDEGTAAVLKLRRVPGFGWFVPFVQTPMNILKQGIEYSPAGFSTMVGAGNKREQMAKALMGSTVFMGAGYLALQDRITWAVPKDKEQREAFYAAGMQPYSVKLGDKWVAYSKLGPMAYPLALAAGMKYAFEDNPEAIAQSPDEKALSALTGTMGFFADQSYMQGIGDLIKSVEGREGFNLSKVASNVATQYVPLSSFQRWVASIVDPIYRKSDTVAGNIAKGIPFLSDNQDYYENPLGEPSQRQFPIGNAFSPVNVTQERQEFKDLYDLRQEELQGNALVRRQEKDLEKALRDPAKANLAEASGGTQDKLATLKNEMQVDLAKERVKLTGKAETVGNVYVFKDGDTTKSIELEFKVPAPELTGREAIDKKLISSFKGKITAKTNDVVDLYEQGVITAEQAEALLTDLEQQRDAITGGSGSGRKLSGMPQLSISTPRTGRSRRSQSSLLPTLQKAYRLSDVRAIKAPRLQS